MRWTYLWNGWCISSMNLWSPKLLYQNQSYFVITKSIGKRCNSSWKTLIPGYNFFSMLHNVTNRHFEVGEKYLEILLSPCVDTCEKYIWNQNSLVRNVTTQAAVQSRGVLKKRCSENMLQIYRRTPMPKCDFNKIAKQLYWNRTLGYVFSCKFTAYFQNTFT